MLTVDANVWIAAADNRDVFNDVSRNFLLEITHRHLPIFLPSFARIEIACALSRRWQNAQAGEELANTLLDSGFVTTIPLDSVVLNHTLKSGTRLLLRGADALYAAVAELKQARLISWDAELIQRAGAITPSDWLTQNSE